MSMQHPLTDFSGYDSNGAEATRPKRKRREVKPRLRGNNRFGRLGTLRCHQCRKWRIKVLFVVTLATSNFSAISISCSLHVEAVRKRDFHAVRLTKLVD